VINFRSLLSFDGGVEHRQEAIRFHERLDARKAARVFQSSGEAFSLSHGSDGGLPIHELKNVIDIESLEVHIAGVVAEEELPPFQLNTLLQHIQPIIQSAGKEGRATIRPFSSTIRLRPNIRQIQRHCGCVGSVRRVYAEAKFAPQISENAGEGEKM
jgi:hypothetical protein